MSGASLSPSSPSPRSPPRPPRLQPRSCELSVPCLTSHAILAEIDFIPHPIFLHSQMDHSGVNSICLCFAGAKRIFAPGDILSECAGLYST